jgi:hypothetical protein
MKGSSNLSKNARGKMPSSSELFDFYLISLWLPRVRAFLVALKFLATPWRISFSRAQQIHSVIWKILKYGNMEIWKCENMEIDIWKNWKLGNM